MSSTRYLLMATTIILAVVILLGVGPILLVAMALLWLMRRWWRQRKGRPVEEPAPVRAEPLCHTWGYVIPLRAVVTEWVPGYVGITRRAPKELPDGRLWCSRWDDDDHQEMAALIDHDRAEVIYVADTWGGARKWEDATIEQYLELGAPLLNKQGNPYR